MKKIQKPKSRYAKLLFNRECPYSQKVVKSKKKYTRKPKYKKDWNDEIQEG